MKRKRPDWYSNVQPRRRMREARKPWKCACVKPLEKLRPAYLLRCPDCGERQP